MTERSRKLSKVEFYSIDYIRVLAMLAVIFIHVRPFVQIDPAITFIINQKFSRFAVPFFLITAGYFYGIKFLSSADLTGWFKKRMKALIRIYLLWTFLYSLPYLDLWVSVLMQGQFLRWLQMILIAPPQVHMWYLPAFIMATLWIYLVHSYFPMARKRLLIISMILLLIGILGDGYYHLTNQLWPINWILTIFGNTRNGIFFAIPYVSLGYLISFISLETLALKKRWLWGGFFISVILVIFEGSLIDTLDIFYDANLLFSHLPLTIFIMLLCLVYPNFMKGSRVSYQAPYTFGVYLNHMIVIVILYIFPINVLRSNVFFEIIYPFLILRLSLNWSKAMYLSDSKWMNMWVKL